MENEIKSFIEKIKKAAERVSNELEYGWDEVVYNKAMEVALREIGLTYETQRILPIEFSGHIVGESKPDFVVWFEKDSKRVAIIVELKTAAEFKQGHEIQIKRYIQELKKQVKKDIEEVWPIGFIFNFVKSNKKIKDADFEELADGKLNVYEIECA